MTSGKYKLIHRASVAAAVSLALYMSPSTVAQDYSAETSLGQTAYDKAEWIFNHVSVSHYKHNKVSAAEQVKVFADGSCQVNSDCSGFVSYVLDSVAKRQYEVIREKQTDRPYPQSKTFAKYFKSLNNSKPVEGWIGIASVKDLRRGDLIAWERKVEPGKRGNTGHVMFVADRPVEFNAVDGRQCVNIPVLDCSSVSHFAPETLPPNTHQSARDGIGIGSVRLILNDDEQAIGYWEGTFSAERGKSIESPSFTEEIGFARLVSIN